MQKATEVNLSYSSMNFKGLSMYDFLKLLWGLPSPPLSFQHILANIPQTSISQESFKGDYVCVFFFFNCIIHLYREIIWMDLFTVFFNFHSTGKIYSSRNCQHLLELITTIICQDTGLFLLTPKDYDLMWTETLYSKWLIGLFFPVMNLIPSNFQHTSLLLFKPIICRYCKPRQIRSTSPNLLQLTTHPRV